MQVPADAYQYATKYGTQYGVDPYLLLSIAYWETRFGTTPGYGQEGYDLGCGATDSGPIPQYRGREENYKCAAQTLSNAGVHNLGQLITKRNQDPHFYATDTGWLSGIETTYKSVLSSFGVATPSGALDPLGLSGAVAGSVGGAAADAASGTVSALSTVAKFLDPKNIIYLLGGLALTIVGIIVFVKPSLPKDAAKAAANVGKEAATAAVVA